MKVSFPFSWWIESLLNFEYHKYKFIFETDFPASTISNRFCEDPDFNKRFKEYVDSSFPYILPKNKK